MWASFNTGIPASWQALGVDRPPENQFPALLVFCVDSLRFTKTRNASWAPLSAFRAACTVFGIAVELIFEANPVFSPSIFEMKRKGRTQRRLDPLCSGSVSKWRKGEKRKKKRKRSWIFVDRKTCAFPFFIVEKSWSSHRNFKEENLNFPRERY